MRVIACCYLLLLCLSVRSQTLTYGYHDLLFEWDLVKDEAHVVRTSTHSQVWQGSLLPAFWLEKDHRKMFVKAQTTGEAGYVGGKWRYPLRIGGLGRGWLTVVKEDWGLRFSALDIEWSSSPPAVIEMYFGASDKYKGTPVQPVWDRPFMPDWQSFGFCVPGGKEGPAQSYFRNWDLGLTNIALGAFGPSMGTPYGAAYPKPLYFSGMGSNEGFIALGAGSIPDAAMSLRVQATRSCFQYVYDEDIWGPLPDRKRSWPEPLRISLGETALEAFQQYYRSFPAKSVKDYVPQPFYNTWGLWRERKYTINPIAEFAARTGAAMLVLDDGWERSQGAGEVNKERFPRLGEDLQALHGRGMTHGIWETLGWIDDTTAAGLTSADLIVDRNGKPCKANWNFDPSSRSFYCLDISSERARNFLRQRTIREMREIQPALFKLDFGYGLPSPSMGVPRNPSYRGERQHVEMIRVIAAAARSVNPSVRVMYYGISPMGIDQVDMVSLDDQGDLWYDIAGGHGEWSIWSSLLSDKNVAISGSSGYSWESDDEVLLNTAVIGCPGATLPITQSDGKPIRAKYLLRRQALNKWYRRTLRWKPSWINSQTGNFEGPPRLFCWGRLEQDTVLTALALREGRRLEIPEGSRIRQMNWKGRWALISQDEGDILSTSALALIPFDEGEIVLPFPSRPVEISRLGTDGEQRWNGWDWADGRLTVRVTEEMLDTTAGFLIRRDKN
ncbi:MAG: hypothetical protein J0H74_09095 [Chitinophagaceae bacterium]|nr:hypothetical protein [Chitinophagaceae bacterium]